MLFYLPLEAYPERYTYQLSAAKTGWYERNWIRAEIPYRRIDGLGEIHLPAQATIETGSVVDAITRPLWCFNQVTKLLQLLDKKAIYPSDTIFLDDFWHPGIEALHYAFHLAKIQPKMYAYLWAQSVDEFDFTYPMRSWMRGVEKGYAAALDGIFVACPTIKELLVGAEICSADKIHVVGLPFDSEEVISRFPNIVDENGNAIKDIPSGKPVYEAKRQNQVVFSSRWDREKNPVFFLGTAEIVLREKPDTKFIICTSAKHLRSNDESLLGTLRGFMSRFPDNIILQEGLTKEEYYRTLCGSKIQFNCASQDFVSFTLLEATCAGCYPIYPYFRSFPETFLHQKQFLYDHLSQHSAANMILLALSQPNLWTPQAIRERSWIYRRFDNTWTRMAAIMGLPGMRQYYSHDPFSLSNLGSDMIESLVQSKGMEKAQ